MGGPNGQKRIIGTCSICGGPVALYEMNTGNYCECDRCRAVPKPENYGPQIAMVPGDEMGRERQKVRRIETTA